ncbi:4-hydroxythreonine-4-phosphate dehydrogenase PdxA [Sphingomonadales bacterium 56]|uniref:4-hydroxythreonine-4-phosphate dehydrogenase PdxA n=1 Tax=unclassified Sphingobium TaxID=2611147 RepID=UPI0019197166|nr:MULTISPECIES: 4-hydroxythreonine-4-phosphate dehydrogenase PdxA [unclassified Sphingobium]MBY2928217.1 4-hydroxythreonine-4-phosphate dehydrogenase PdxA [Sphingomonadales bacterium 56]MBY2958317.1 4-hydroxythreonine-4-phosphate dehydrogenase PdxA [Sphingomonadales bacterium 58]
MPSSTITDPAPARSELAPFAVPLGDPAGIGPEIVAKSWVMRKARGLPSFFAVGDAASLRRVWAGPVAPIATPQEAVALFDSALPCLQVADAGDIVPGSPSVDGARTAFQALEAAVGLARTGSAAGIVTAPVGKEQLYGVGFTHPGQTEFVAERCGVAPHNAVMMLAGPSLKVVPVTIHIPLADVPSVLTIDLIRARATTTVKGLQRNFGIPRPRIVVAGLNPHAGEGGALGREEIEIISPAIDSLREEGMDIVGPLSADGLFHARARETYDAVLCMYHDQALIPLKTLHFDEGVNITLGLPIVRTSPDHGTAFGIAGKDSANPGAMMAALKMAAEAARSRLSHGL